MGRSTCAAWVALGAVVLAVSPASADVKTGVDAWTRGDYSAAVREWQGPAGKGDADAQFNLAQAYKLGRGVKQDLAKAEDMFGRAAAQGHPQASDNYGLLLFQRGERARALPYVQTAAGRGDPRAQYLLGIAHFNGDGVPKDWVRAYALTSLAQSAGLAQAVPALTQMNQHIPLEQRQEAASLASELASEAEATRARQLAAADLGARLPSGAAPASPAAARPTIASAENAVAAAVRVAGNDSPRTAGADYARPKDPQPLAVTMRPSPSAPPPSAGRSPIGATKRPTPAPTVPPASASRPPAPEAPARPAAAGGPWRVQLGAFGVRGNADALWNRLKSRPELSGRGKLLVPAGSVTKLQAGGFASSAEAQAACTKLSAAGFACLPTRN